jgi:hypothetical protein
MAAELVGKFICETFNFLFEPVNSVPLPRLTRRAIVGFFVSRLLEHMLDSLTNTTARNGDTMWAKPDTKILVEKEAGCCAVATSSFLLSGVG